ncbi:unnamed protein product [Calicophoron daubneyi]|uniref:Uncharacterized protein n=1 Tax=Calicophoron daubneyi TaxID=300641 RepID=A0AAV2TU65_CALDB
MNEETEYDVPSETIQAAIMENFVMTQSLGREQCIVRGDGDSPIIPYIRPPPEELFVLSDEEKIGFENLRRALAPDLDEGDKVGTQASASETDQNDLAVPNRDLQSLGGGGDQGKTSQAKMADTYHFEANREARYDRYYPHVKLVLNTDDKRMAELDKFLEEYEVPEEDLERVFDFEPDSIAHGPPSNGQGIEEYLKNACESYSLAKYKAQIPETSEPNSVWTNSNHHERKTVYCDLRESAPKRNVQKSTQEETKQLPIASSIKSLGNNADSSSEEDAGGLWLDRYRDHRRRNQRNENTNETNLCRLTTNEHRPFDQKKVANVSAQFQQAITQKSKMYEDLEDLANIETYLERRRKYCEDLLRSNGVLSTRGVLLHEESSFSPAISIISPDTEVYAPGQVMQLTYRVWEEKTKSLDSETQEGGRLQANLYSSTVFFAVLSWLLSILPEQVQTDKRNSFTFSILGLIQAACTGCEQTRGWCNVRNLRLCALIRLHEKVDPDETNTHRLQELLDDCFRKHIAQWNFDTNLLLNSEEVILPSISCGKTGHFELDCEPCDLWCQKEFHSTPSIYWGSKNCGLEKVDTSGIAEQTVGTPDDQYCASYARGMYELLDNEVGTVVLELSLNSLKSDVITDLVYATLTNMHLRGLDLVGVRTGWVQNRDATDVIQPHVVFAFRGPEAWKQIKTVSTWILSKFRGIDSNDMRCHGSRFGDLNMKHLVRWFGPHLPDVAVLSPVMIARAKHQGANLLKPGRDCWLVRPEPGDLVLALSKAIWSTLPDLIESAIELCGYQLVGLGRPTHNPSKVPTFLYAAYLAVPKECPAGGKNRSIVVATGDEDESELNVEDAEFSADCLLVIRRENPLGHLPRLMNCIKLVLRKILGDGELGLLSEAESTKMLICILPFQKSLTYLLNMKTMFHLPELASEPLQSSTFTGEADCQSAPYRDCDSLAFVLLAPCIRAKSHPKLSTHFGKFSSVRQPNLTLSGFLAHLNDQMPRTDVIAIKWLLINQVPISIWKSCASMITPMNHPDQAELASKRRHKPACGFGAILIRGADLEETVVNWCKSSGVAYCIDLGKIKVLARMFFFTQEISAIALRKNVRDIPVDRMNNKTKTESDRMDTALFDKAWDNLMTLIYRNWKVDGTAFVVPWSHKVNSSQWLNNLIAALHILLKEGYTISGMMTTNAGETFCHVSRSRALDRLWELCSSPVIRWSGVQKIMGLGGDSDEDDYEMSRPRLSELITGLPDSSEMSESRIKSMHDLLCESDKRTASCNCPSDETIAIRDDLLGRWSTNYAEANLIVVRVCRWESDENFVGNQSKRSAHRAENHWGGQIMRLLKILSKHHILLVGIRWGILNKEQIERMDAVNLKDLSGNELKNGGKFCILAVISTVSCASFRDLIKTETLLSDVINEESERIYIGDEKNEGVTNLKAMIPFLLPVCRIEHI